MVPCQRSDCQLSREKAQLIGQNKTEFWPLGQLLAKTRQGKASASWREATGSAAGESESVSRSVVPNSLRPHGL